MLKVNNISKSFGLGSAKVTALDDISLRVNQGEFIAIMGPSGCGKTTLLNIIGGLEQPSSGEVILDGQRIDNMDENSLVSIRRDKIAYVFQSYHLIPSLTALENVLLPMTFRGDHNERARALGLLEKVGLKERAGHKPGELSGGEQQRVAIARAIISRPSLLLADEPTGNMDQKIGREILALFNRLNKEGQTIIMVTHSLEIAEGASGVIVLQDGQVKSKKNASCTKN
ncbi:MAG: ABC transporter ATP-binding protein [Chloroflexi bacterium]|nr:ABC transporter ATP-binding protein [Chloroflexota bacterium]MBM4450571.1 ABC transporter ATP-binding protein [Chloroflexota bacterium]